MTSHSNAYAKQREALEDAVRHLREADAQLCAVVASIAADRGWREGDPYEATPAEQRWHALIHDLAGIRDRIEGVPFASLCDVQRGVSDVP